MCGILGATFERKAGIFEKALSYIAQRGPDFQAVNVCNGVMLGHTRLAILDLDSRSNQPFQYLFNGKAVFIVFNGEIYNFLDLKKRLSDLGYVFNTNSDTEVICAAYLEWGIECFDYFLGMWSLSILHDDIIVLARDRNGKKPLYYSNKNDNLYFSSSLKSVQVLIDNSNISQEALDLYFALGFVPAHFSIYSGIYKVLPGEILKFKRQGQYNYFKECSCFSKRKDLTVQKSNKIRPAIKEAVERRLISDVPIATLMSGGVDSTIVSYYVQKAKSDAVSYFVDFDDKALSERSIASYLSERNKLKQNVSLLSSEKILEEFLYYYKVYEEPFADYSGIPSIAIFREASKHHKVILTGDGGDELFFGYPYYFFKWVLLRSYCILKHVSWLANALIPSWKVIFTGGAKKFESGYLSRHGIVTDFAKNFIDDVFNSFLNRSNSILRGLIEYDRSFYNWPEKYLVKVDRSSMAFGVEVRSPFMDEQLKELTEDLSLFYLFTPYSSKLMLKLRFFDLFGIRYLFKKKRGFTPPIQVLRDKYFGEKEFYFTKEIIRQFSKSLYYKINNIEFKTIQQDKILFDRFFFFHNWVINEDSLADEREKVFKAIHV
jgi:asparagine synthase (glutamine-hydrolysing)